jgi:DNA-binding NtrC family response regulator
MSKDLNGDLRALVDELVDKGLTLGQARREFERQFIVAALRSHQGNLGGSAKSLGIHRNTLRNKVGDLGIVSEDYAQRQRRRPRSRT